MSYAVQPQNSAFIAFPAHPDRQIRRILCQPPCWLLSITSELFAKSSHLAHYKALNESSISFTINRLRTLVQFAAFSISTKLSLFNRIRTLCQKTGGWGRGTLAMSPPSIDSPQTARFLFISLHRTSSLGPLINSPRTLRVAPAAPVYLLDATLRDETSDGPETWYKA